MTPGRWGPGGRYGSEPMHNGLTRVQDYASGLSACFNTETGCWVHGDLFRCTERTLYELMAETERMETDA